MRSLEPESMRQCGNLTCKELVKIVFIPAEVVMEDGVDMTWLVVGEGLEDAEGSKDYCWSKHLQQKNLWQHLENQKHHLNSQHWLKDYPC